MRPLLEATSHALRYSVVRPKSTHLVQPICVKYYSNSSYDIGKESNRIKKFVLAAAVGSVATAIGASYFSRDGDRRNLRSAKIISRAEVAKHDSLEKGVWITYKGQVYDITKFIEHHPGGSHTIMMGAGGDVEPFWQTYTVHQAIEVQNLLSQYRIGVLPARERHAELVCNQAKSTKKDQENLGPYSNDPKRSPLLKVHTKEPFNAETPPKLLVSSKITPVDLFFVRNHLPVPEVDLEDYTLSICLGTDGDADNQKLLAEFTLDDLKTKFKPHTIDCVIQCSGNRRTDLKKIKEIKGLDWNVGAMGNAKWTGVRLVDLLDSLDLKAQDDKSIKHVQMEGLDCDMSGQSYGASISADAAFDPKREVLLAYEMNGQPLSRDHGFPLRFVAPGITGARNVKWLSKIILSHEESNSHWQRNDYKSFSPQVDMFSLDYKQAASIQEMPVQSAICDPVHGDTVKVKRQVTTGAATTIPVRGYAYSGGGKMVVRVDVSIDGGETWMTAKLDDQPKDSEGNPDFTFRNQVWSWSRWSLEVPVPEEILRERNGSLELLCRCFDAAYNSQPERAETIWNVRGVVNNAWHRVKIGVEIE